MQRNYWKNKLKSAGLAFSLLLGVGAASGITAQAQYPQYPNDQYRQNRNYDRDQYDRNRDYNNQNDRWRDRDYRRGRRQNRSNDDYPNWGGSFQLRQTALNAGYNNGIEEGRKDRQKRDRYDFRDEGDFQKATADYSSRLGDRELYRRYFREAFTRGYEAGFNGY
jgi:hypothetical protein